MKVQSTMYYGKISIAEVTWELDDRARTAQQALAALSIEDNLRAELKIEHKIIKDEPEPEIENVSEDQSDTETSEPSDQSVQSDEDGEHNGMDYWADVDEDRS
jgi:hypothetical protein